VLYRKWTPLDGSVERLQVILPKEFRAQFVRLAHSGMTGGHLGRQKTEEQVQRRAYWPRWRSDVARELKKCINCAQYHRGKAPKQTPLQSFNAGEPFEVIAVDITGKHPKSLRGNEYIVTVSCLFSRWADAFPVRNHTAPVVVIRCSLSSYSLELAYPKELSLTWEQSFKANYSGKCVGDLKSIKSEQPHTGHKLMVRSNDFIAH